ncbi:MAG TPA: hypothetical protein DD670_17150 [Planctomycetaceae bacterium]|nr:hypothetical protein [Planctomycetaceae bacterium]
MFCCILSWTLACVTATDNVANEPAYLENGTPEVGGVRHLCLVYHGRAQRVPWTAEALLPYVTYVDERGKPVDWLFDSFLFIEFANDKGISLYHDTGKKPWPTADDWKWLADAWFRENTGLIGLERAMTTAGKALGETNRTANVVISVPLPQRSIRQFGPLLGQDKVLDFSKPEDRRQALAWYIDQIWSRYNESDLPHLRLVGFYWMSESIAVADHDLVEWLARYIHEKGVKFYWIPYFKAAGVEKWKDRGFDAMMLQPNHFFHEKSPASRLQDTATRARKIGSGVEMEFDSRALDSEIFREHFYDYLDAGAKHGWMTDSILGWYEGGGAIKKMLDEPDKGRPLYDALYRFVKGTYMPREPNRPSVP